MLTNALHLHLFTIHQRVLAAGIVHHEQTNTAKPHTYTFDAQTFNFNYTLDMQNAMREEELSIFFCSRARCEHIVIIIIFTFNATVNACFFFIQNVTKTTTSVCFFCLFGVGFNGEDNSFCQ